MKGDAMPDEEYRPAPRWKRGEPEADLNEEMWRLVRLTRESGQRRADAERRLRARLSGYRPVDEVFAAEERHEVNGNGKLPYPRSWYEAAERARQDPSPKRPRFDVKGRPRDD